MEDDMRTCKYCGRETGKASNFCWYCARELEARPERPDASPTQSKAERWLLAGIALVILIVAGVILISPLLR